MFRKVGRLAFASFLLLSIFIIGAGAQDVLTWQDCIKEAQKNHPDLISAEEGVKQSEAAKKITASTLFPQVNSNVGAATAKTTSDTSTKTTDTYTYGVTATQLLFDAAKTANDVKAASENIQAARHSYRFTSSFVRFRLRTAFINLLKAQELLNITEQIKKIRRDNLILIALRYESGLEHKGALLTAEANVAQAEFEVTQAKRALEVAQKELTKEMGRIQFAPMRVEGAFEVNDTSSEKPDFKDFVEKNPSLGRSVARRNAASFGVKAAQANFFPTLSAQAGANKTSSRWLPENDQWNAALSLSFPLFEGWLKSAELAGARSVFNQARADERSTKDGVVLALEQAWAALQDAAENVDVQKKFLTASEERSKIAESQYSLGMIQFDNWTIIEDDLVRAKKAFLDAQAGAMLAEAEWIQAKGEVLEYAQ